MFSPGRTTNVPVRDRPVMVEVDRDMPALRVLNSGRNMVFVSIGGEPATTSSYPVLAQSESFILKGVGAGMVSLIGTTEAVELVYVTTGGGL